MVYGVAFLWFTFLIYLYQSFFNNAVYLLSLRKMEAEEIGGEEIDEEESENEFYETIKILLMAIQAIVIVLKDTMVMIPPSLLNRRSITRKWYNYIHKVSK